MIRRPSPKAIDRFLSAQMRVGFSYSEVGSTCGEAPFGYTVDHNRICLGHGIDVFRRAVESVQRWKMFDLGWVELFPRDSPMDVNTTVAVLVHHFGFWSLNACRVVYAFNEERCFGFAYGTLRDHAEQGEEKFSIDWSGEDGLVWYDILAYSRPGQWQAKVAWPLGRMLQKKFAQDSKAAMTRSVQNTAAQRSSAAER